MKCVCVCLFSELYQSVSVQSVWGRFLYDGFSLCEQPLTVDIMETLTVINCCIFSLNSTYGQSEVSPRLCPTETIWNPRLTGYSTINQKFRSFSSFVKVPVEAVTNTWTDFTSDRDSLSWNSRLRFGRLSQDDFCWWTWKTWKRGVLLRQIQLGERWSPWKQKSIISLTWRIDGRR